jgi:hypothetical protein
MNNHEPPTHLALHLICCCYASKTSSSRSSTCIYDRENRSSKSSSSAILHPERSNKILGSDIRNCSLASSSSSLQLIYLFVERAPSVIAFNVNSVKSIAIFIRSSSSRNRKSCSQIMSYIFNILICVGMILLDNFL